MFDIHKIKKVLRKVFTPVTIMLVPHSKDKPLNFKIPFIGILTSILLWFLGTIYVFTIAVDTFQYYQMKEKLNYYSQEFLELNTTISALKKAENEFKKLFSLGSREKVLENIDTLDSGSIDMENLKFEINKTTETISEIKNYLRIQHDIYFATPKGLPIRGDISSHYGYRESPITGKREFHSGLDVSTRPGSPVKATADGIVSFSGWNGGSGNLVVLEHGHGFSTLYAHNKINTVKVGQRVRRDDVISYVGSTGNSTGPHVHYEIWKDGRHVNPQKYIEGGS